MINHNTIETDSLPLLSQFDTMSDILGQNEHKMPDLNLCILFVIFDMFLHILEQRLRIGLKMKLHMNATTAHTSTANQFLTYR